MSVRRRRLIAACARRHSQCRRRVRRVVVCPSTPLPLRGWRSHVVSASLAHGATAICFASRRHPPRPRVHPARLGAPSLESPLAPAPARPRRNPTSLASRLSRIPRSTFSPPAMARAPRTCKPYEQQRKLLAARAPYAKDGWGFVYVHLRVGPDGEDQVKVGETKSMRRRS